MSRTLVIGLELGDGPLLLEGAGSGRLPRLRALLDRGTHGLLGTTAEQLHVSAWPSLYTGVGPGEHGVYYTFQPAPGVQGHQRFHEGIYGSPTVWRMLAAGGRRVTVFDAPYTHAEPGYPGPQVIDWGAWAQYLRKQSTPAELLGELERAIGSYPLGLEAHDIGLEAQDPDDIERRVLRALPVKARAAAWLMGKQPWDVFLTVFGETHAAAHYCWSPRDPAQTRLGRIHEALDSAIGEVVDAAGEDTTVLVLSGDAIGPNHAGWHLMPEVLAKLGMFVSSELRQSDDRPPPPPTGFDPVKAVRDLMPKGVRKSLARLLPTEMRDRLAKRVDTAAVDWTRTRAFCLPSDLEGLIRVNLKGREPMGTVEPGEEYERLLDELTEALRILRDPANDRPVVAHVLRADTAFPGARRDHLPDLVVLWSSPTPIEAVTSPAIGVVAAASPDGRPGTHRGPGFVIAAGPGIPASQSLDGADIFGLAPTLLARHGVAPPAHLGGRAWAPLLG